MKLLSLEPESSASANSATSAYIETPHGDSFYLITFAILSTANTIPKKQYTEKSKDIRDMIAPSNMTFEKSEEISQKTKGRIT